MDFTREPIIETVITPKEGYKLVVRSSKAAGQEEFFVDAVEVVSFGKSMFFRSQEKPKSFLVPTSDYEVLEVREARMVLKHVGVDRSIKIGGGKENARPPREAIVERAEPVPTPIPVTPTVSEAALATPADAPIPEDAKQESRFERKRDRRRHYRRRRGREEGKEGWAEGPETEELMTENEKVVLTPPREADVEGVAPTPATISTSMLSSLLPPPPNLISETIAKYRENDKFKDVFFPKNDKGEEEQALNEVEDEEEDFKTIEDLRSVEEESPEQFRHAGEEAPEGIEADFSPLAEELHHEDQVVEHEESIQEGQEPSNSH